MKGEGWEQEDKSKKVVGWYPGAGKKNSCDISSKEYLYNNFVVELVHDKSVSSSMYWMSHVYTVLEMYTQNPKRIIYFDCFNHN